MISSATATIRSAPALLSVRFLMRYFTTNQLNPFAWYCIVVGLVTFGYVLVHDLGISLIHL